MELYPRPQGPLQTSTGMACLQWTRSPLLFGAPLGDHLCRPEGWLGLWGLGGECLCSLPFPLSLNPSGVAGP